MTKKRALIYALIASLLAILVYVQFRTWRNFDWAVFRKQTDQVFSAHGLLHIFGGIACTYFAYVLRSLRWRIFLRPVKKTTTASLLAPTIIGFTGLALLGRPGEMIRPYLIARKENLSLSSQLAVWTVERIFDVGAFATLLVIAIFFAQGPRQLGEYYGKFREGGLLLIALVAGLIIAMLVIARVGDVVANWVERRFAHHATGLGHKIAARVREFRGGLNTIHGFSELAQLIAVSLVLWYSVALAYQQITGAYGVSVLSLPVSQVLLLMASSMIGSLVQLPGVGGGSQLAIITTLQHVFKVPRELALSCGILLWLVTFMSVIPLGLALAHRERLSIRGLSKETAVEGDKV
jgi:glycosyltransferase 2 family protein